MSYVFFLTLAERIGWTLLHSLWQFSLIAGLLLLILRMLRHQSSAHRYLAELTALSLMVVTALVTVLAVNPAQTVMPAAPPTMANDTADSLPRISAPDEAVQPTDPAAVSSLPADSSFSSVAESLPTSAMPAELSQLQRVDASAATDVTPVGWRQSLAEVATPWLTEIVIGWLAGMVLLSIRPVVGWRAATRLRQCGVSEVQHSIRDTVRQTARRVGVWRVVQVVESSLVEVPTVIGWLKPLILLPASSLTGLSQSQLEAVLAHELAHVRRHDYLVNALQVLLETVFFYHPAVWWVSYRMRVEREDCCDDIAVALTGDRTGYVRLLVWLEERRGNRPVAVGAMSSSGGSLRDRARRIIRPQSVASTGSSGIWLLLMVFLLAGGGVWLSAQAQDRLSDRTGNAEPDPSSQQTDPDHSEAAITEQQAAESTVQERGSATVSGRILLPDGSPANVEGQLVYRSNLNGSGSSGNAGDSQPTFELEVPAGEVVLSFFPDNYAPVWTEPLTLAAGATRTDIELQLTQGHTARVHVRSSAGTSIREATVVALPVVHGQVEGFIVEHQTDSDGQLTLQHLADADYVLQVSAAGYESLRTEPLALDGPQPVIVTLKPAAPASGVIVDESGQPVAGAKLRALYEASQASPNQVFGNTGSGFFGTVLTESDAEGRFTLDSLTSGSHYLMLVEGPDQARLIRRDLQAGQQDLRIVLPSRVDLKIRLIGDLTEVRQRNGQPFVAVRQSISLKTAAGNWGALVGSDVQLERTETGAAGVYRGLAIDPDATSSQQLVSVMPGYDYRSKKQIRFNPQGSPEIEFILNESGPTADESAIEDQPQSEAPAGSGPVLRGTISLQDGTPLSGVVVKTYGGVATRFAGQQTETDASGSYEFAPLKTGARLGASGSNPARLLTGVQFEHPEYVPADGKSWRDISVPLTENQQQVVNLQMIRGGQLQGTVIDHQTGQPAADLSLRIHNGIDQAGSATGDYLLYATTDKRGDFLAGPLPPGRFIVDINDGDFRGEKYPRIGSAEVVAGETANSEFTTQLLPRLMDPFVITGTAYGQDGEPMTYGGVELQPEDPDVQLRSRGGGIDGRPRFSLRVGPVQRIDVSESAPYGVGTLDVKLIGRNPRKGYVLVSRTPAEPLRLTDDPNMPAVNDGYRYLKPGEPVEFELVFAKVETDSSADGASSDTDSRDFAAFAQGSSGPENPNSGGADTARADASTAVEQNLVVDATDRPIVGAQVNFLGQRSYSWQPPVQPLATTVTDQQGRFEYPESLSELNPFYVSVTAEGFLSRVWQAPREVYRNVDGTRQPDKLTLFRPVTIQGRILDQNGLPLADAEIAVDYFMTDGPANINGNRVRSDADGRFTATDVLPAHVFVRYETPYATPDERSPTGVQPGRLCIAHIQPADGQTVDDVVLDLRQATCVLEGIITNADGQGAAGQQIRATLAAAHGRLDESISVRSGADGRFRFEGLTPDEFVVGTAMPGFTQTVTLDTDRVTAATLHTYLPGQPAEPATVESIQWGPPNADGLVAGIRLTPPQQSYSLGDLVNLDVVIRNPTDSRQVFQHTFSRQTNLHISNTAGEAITDLNYAAFTGFPAQKTFVLEPGQLATLGSFEVGLVAADNNQTSPPQSMFKLPGRPGQTLLLTGNLATDVFNPAAASELSETRFITGTTPLEIQAD